MDYGFTDIPYFSERDSYFFHQRRGGGVSFCPLSHREATTSGHSLRVCCRSARIDDRGISGIFRHSVGCGE